jgi:hypothetical protein
MNDYIYQKPKFQTLLKVLKSFSFIFYLFLTTEALFIILQVYIYTHTHMEFNVASRPFKKQLCNKHQQANSSHKPIDKLSII